ncbi:MAG: glutamate--tRNA ligase [Syntrophomonadaceae bacterium]|nr:glutamate--tRNA ligase [Syntrophomonadaceae bacterium]
MNSIRVRFAPSPTGALHIGGARTALFNWLFARQLGGSLVLRIEDTDANRSNAESIHGIIDGLKWLGIDWNEGPDRKGALGPYYQSQRLDKYKYYAEMLLAEGKAYRCFCSAEELDAQRQQAAAEKRNYRYNRCCSYLSPEEITSKKARGSNYVIRLRCPDSGVTVVNDQIRGKVEFQNELMEDMIIFKSDGWPTYNFAVVIDDHLMHISHVIRAEEHLSNTPKQLMVYDALGWTPPLFAHVSMILAPDRSKLSKRHGATSVQEFRDDGYLPESLINYLALLGWSPGDDREIMSINEIIEQFSLDKVSKSPAIYDLEKLMWMNAQYIANTPLAHLCRVLEPKARELGYLQGEQYQYFMQVVNLIRSRMKNLNDFEYDAAFFFRSIEEYDQTAVNKYFAVKDAGQQLTALRDQFAAVQDFNAAFLETHLRSIADSKDVKPGKLIHPLRLALTGRAISPGIFEVMALLGKARCIERLDQAIEYIKKNYGI